MAEHASLLEPARRSVAEDASATRAAVVYDRTSGDESTTDQSPKEQLALTVELARRFGGVVAGEFSDPDVKGDVPWDERPGLLAALARAKAREAVLFVREVSRLWRGLPEAGLSLLASVPDLEVHGEPVFQRRGGAWVRDTDADHLMRFIGLWQPWAEKRRIATRTQQTMTEIKEGRRETKSKKPHHRPPVEFDPAHLEEARRVYARGGRGAMTNAWRRFLELRGYDEAKDTRTKKARFISKTKVGELLGVYSVGKGDASERVGAPPESGSIAQVSLPDNGGALQ